MGLSLSAERLSFHDASAVDLLSSRTGALTVPTPPHIGMCGVVEVAQRWRCGVSSSCLSKRIPYGDYVGNPQTQNSICDISSYNNPHAENQEKSMQGAEAR